MQSSQTTRVNVSGGRFHSAFQEASSDLPRLGTEALTAAQKHPGETWGCGQSPLGSCEPLGLSPPILPTLKFLSLRHIYLG